MTKLNIWFWTKKWFIKILIALGIIGIGIAATIGSPTISFVDVNGEQIIFAYTDDNTNENLIIRTDKEVYGGWDGADVYMMVEKNINIFCTSKS